MPENKIKRLLPFYPFTFSWEGCWLRTVLRCLLHRCPVQQGFYMTAVIFTPELQRDDNGRHTKALLNGTTVQEMR